MGALRPPLFVQQGEYDALDFRRMLSRLRAPVQGVVDGFTVSAVSAQTARVSVALGDAWVPFTPFGSLDGKNGAYVYCEEKQEFDLNPPSVGEVRTDYLCIVVDEKTDPDTFVRAGDANAVYTLGDLSSGWGFVTVQGPPGGSEPAKVPDNALVLAAVTLTGGKALDATSVKDMRFSFGTQKDAAPLVPVRTNGGLTVASVRDGLRNGTIIYDQTADTLHYAMKGSKSRPVERGTQWYRGAATDRTIKGGGTGVGNVWFGLCKLDIPAADYARVVSLTSSFRGNATAAASGNITSTIGFATVGDQNGTANGIVSYSEVYFAPDSPHFRGGASPSWVLELAAGAKATYWLSIRPKPNQELKISGNTTIFATVSPKV
jgi:hypothetical protein